MPYVCSHPGCQVIVQWAGEMCRPHREQQEKEKGIPVAPPPEEEPPPAPPMGDGLPQALPVGQIGGAKAKQKQATDFDNCSSRVPIGQINTFVDTLLKVVELKPPVFSVCDCNSFHTSGYLWGWYAIRKALDQEAGPVAVVNIDQHADTGARVTYAVKSDGWGEPLIGMIEKDPWNTQGCYLSTPNADYQQALATTSKSGPDPQTPDFPAAGTDVTNETGSDVNVKILFGGAPIDECILTDVKTGEPDRFDVQPGKTFRLPAGDKVKFTYKGENPPSWKWQKMKAPKPNRDYRNENYESLWSNLRSYLGIQAFKYIFVSVDLDCVKDNYTQWGDTKSVINDTSELVDIVKKVTSPLFSKDRAKLIGFDVTGLPEHTSLSGPSNSPAVDVWGTIDKRIVELQKWAFLKWQPSFAAEEGVDLRRKSQNLVEKHDVATKVVFYSGSVGYVGAGWDNLATKWNYGNFTGCVARGLPGLLNSNDWKYVLCQQDPPVFALGRKKFKLYGPEKPIPASLGWPSADKPDEKKKKELEGQLETGEDLEKGAQEALGKGKELGEGFECSMSLKGVSELKPMLMKLRETKPDLKKATSKQIKITSVNGPLEAVDNFDFWKAQLTVESKAMDGKGVFDQKHTRASDPISPPLDWGNPPEGTQSIAVIGAYADNMTTMHTHWVVFGLPGNLTGLPENMTADPRIKCKSGTNEDGTTGYGKLVRRSKTARIQFKVYAADIQLALDESARGKDVEQALEGHTLGYGFCEGTYES